MNSINFQAGQRADDAHLSLVTSLEAMDHARQCSVLWFADILKRKLFQELGYSSMRQYAIETLGFSQNRCSEFLRLAGKLDELPTIRESLNEGRLGYTKAHEIIKVATPKTVARWVDVAEKSSRKELAQKVKAVQVRAKRLRVDNPTQESLLKQEKADVIEIPVRVTLEMTPIQFARYEALIERLYKQGHGKPDKVEALLAGLEEAAGISNDTTPTETTECTTDNRRRSSQPPVQVHIHKCPDCEDKSIQTSRGEQRISSRTYDQANCDAVVANRSIIPPKRRREIMNRARHHCESPGCSNTRFLEIHHIVPRAKGGTNAPENLIVLCSACHRYHHQRPRKSLCLSL